ncbi:hypothetical protein AQUCO_01400422v1 [Aquilegia coerulea]|uniref:TSL-kinase interacting protein 1 n=1 Tax=Aquilegia coerulea TaxID=218851 RepID=A0A2G5DX38_AQUCA|nr:hypothetical protein AQUCO_01400422v1 [Aquilegia coerulea]
MKTAKKQPQTSSSETSVIQSNVGISIGSTKVKALRKKPGGRQRKRTGINDACLIEKENHAPSKAQKVCKQFPFIGTCLPETQNAVPTLEEEGRQVLQSSARMKVQLFPIDVTTQQELEKGGYNPHLELTVSRRKKISSVLRHLKSKWGSVYNMGEIMLFPYHIQLENLAGERRWTSEDTETSAADVYTSIGSPAIFRLRYGWFPSSMSLSTPFTSSLFKDCLQNENIKQGESINVEVSEVERQQCDTVTKECAPISYSDSPNAVQVECMRSDRADEPLENSRNGRGLAPSSSIWTDSLTNISIGGLLSEASLHAAPNQTDPVPAGNNSYLQIPFSCDSFDAAIAAHIYRHTQDPQRVSNGSQSSFLDADETRHAFTFPKSASLGKDAISSSKSTTSVSCIQEGNTQAGCKQNHTSQSTQEMNNVSSSLGKGGITLTDSLGPLDLGLSSRQLISGENISLSSFLAKSLDANCSLFRRDISLELAPS